jgi:hypothetical protein
MILYRDSDAEITMKSHEKSPPAEAEGPLDRTKRPELALTALLAGLLLAALLAALTARILLLLTGLLLARILLAALLTTMVALTALAALLPALIWIVSHRKRLLIAGRPREISTIHWNVGSGFAVGTCRRIETNASQEPMRFREHK